MTEVTREVPVETITIKIIKLMNGGGLPQPTEVSASNVAELREELGLDGSVIVNDVVADANGTTPITDGDRVSHVSGGKRGGK